MRMIAMDESDILRKLFPTGIPPEQFGSLGSLLKVVGPILEENERLKAALRDSRASKSVAKPVSEPVTRSVNEDATLALLRRGATAPELAAAQDISEQAARVRINRLKAKGYKFKTERLPNHGRSGRPEVRYTLTGEP